MPSINRYKYLSQLNLWVHIYRFFLLTFHPPALCICRCIANPLQITFPEEGHFLSDELDELLDGDPYAGGQIADLFHLAHQIGGQLKSVLEIITL